MKKVEFVAKWALRVAVIGSLMYTLIKGNWIGTAGGSLILAVTFLVDYINEKLFKIDPAITSMAYIFCIFSLVMGTMWRFYDLIGWWDLLMHIASGVILGIIGNIILNKLMGDKAVPPLVRFIFILGVACIGGIAWEMYEFMVDTLFKIDTQVVKMTGVSDTMGDLITDFVGGAVAGAVISFFSKKK